MYEVLALDIFFHNTLINKFLHYFDKNLLFVASFPVLSTFELLHIVIIQSLNFPVLSKSSCVINFSNSRLYIEPYGLFFYIIFISFYILLSLSRICLLIFTKSFCVDPPSLVLFGISCYLGLFFNLYISLSSIK